MRIAFFGDVMGKSGRQAVQEDPDVGAAGAHAQDPDVRSLPPHRAAGAGILRGCQARYLILREKFFCCSAAKTLEMLRCSKYMFYQTTKRGDPNPKEIEQWLNTL